MKHALPVLFVATLANFTLACATDPEGQTSAETGDERTPCEGRAEVACYGELDPNDQLSGVCTWTSLIPLTDPGNSCAMGAPVGRCMEIAPVLDGCGGVPELECTLGDTTEYGTGAVVEIDGQIYLLDGTIDCWPPMPMTTCETTDTEPGCECACDLILGG